LEIVLLAMQKEECTRSASCARTTVHTSFSRNPRVSHEVTVSFPVTQC
jgi:hypothetical protein